MAYGSKKISTLVDQVKATATLYVPTGPKKFLLL